MTDVTPPSLARGKIVKALLLALILALIILVTAVLPAEYGIDPLGTGKLLGFSRLYQPQAETKTNSLGETTLQQSHPILKMEDAGSGPDVLKPTEADDPAPEKQLAERGDSIQVKVPAGKGIEYKIYMLKYGEIKYEWKTDKGIVFFDFHGDVKLKKPGKNNYFKSYTVAYADNMIGTMLAPFEGNHGWYFQNKGKADMIVNIRLKGEYTLLK